MSLVSFFERLFFYPRRVDFIVSILLYPLSIVYGSIGLIKQIVVKPKDYGIKIISIGNLIVGGSGKTPFAISLIEYLTKGRDLKIFYISRGYGRESRGLVEVKIDGKILVDVKASGDEAMLVAKSTRADVVVSEDRVAAIKLAKAKGANLIISHHPIIFSGLTKLV